MASSSPLYIEQQSLSSPKSISVMLDKLTVHHAAGIDPCSITEET